MIHGTVNAEREPIITVSLAGSNWPATIDTGFNCDLELPEAVRSHVNPRFIGVVRYELAGGQVVQEENYLVDFPFDGQTVTVEAPFVVDGGILIGTRMLSQYRLEINFVTRVVVIDRVP
jgi:predicted aspartyl protease